MMISKNIIVCFLLILPLLLFGETPEYYRFLAKDMHEKAGELPKKVKFSSFWKPYLKEQKQGYAVCVTGPSVSPRPDYIWQKQDHCKEVKSFLAQGEFRAIGVALRILKNTENLNCSVSDLKNSKGDIVSKNNINIQRVKYLGAKSWNGKNCFLISEIPAKLHAGQTLWVWLTLHVPESTKPGLYTGTLKISSEKYEENIPVTLRVLNLHYKMPEIAAGTYLPGHFWSQVSKGQYLSYCPKWWNSKNFHGYLAFLKSRGMNSPVLCHVYPELSYKNGKVYAEFPFIDMFANAMKKVGMKGPLGIDTRMISWWANRAARKLAKMPKGFKGDLKVSGNDGFLSGQYPELAKKLYGEAVKLLCENAQKNKWPRYLLFAEEEVGFPTHKTIGYEAFMPTLVKSAGIDNVFLIDNAIGYPGNLIDRGERDKLKYRSYNNWTRKGLQDAKKSKAEVWSYNMGWNRPAAGYYLELIGSKGYHQWADAWKDRNTKANWYVSITTDKGMVSSVELERTHEGFGDLFYFHLLDEYIGKLEKSNKLELADHIKKLKKGFFANVPVKRYAFFSFANRFSDKDYDMMRWKCVCAIDKARKALGEKTLIDPEINNKTGKYLDTRAYPVQTASLKSKGKIIFASKMTEKLKFDGKDGDKCWRARGCWTDHFSWTGAKEAAMRARAGNEEEFRRMNKPSGTSVAVAYDNKGIYMFSGCNHVNPKAKCVHKDDSPELWADDCMEFFFRETDSKPLYQLIVNAQGKRVLLKDNAVVKCKVKVVSVSPLNGSGGVGQEIYIPWKDLGRKSPPVLGSVWRFNACREFHSWNQLSCWSQVFAKFGLADGVLCFNGINSQGKVFFDSKTLSKVYLGKNKVKGKLTFPENFSKANTCVKLYDIRRRLVAKSPVNAKESSFLMDFKVPAMKYPVTWTLEVWNSNKVIGSTKLAIPAAKEILKLNSDKIDAYANDSFKIKVFPKIGNESLKAAVLTGFIIGKNKKTYKLKPCRLQEGDNYVSISTKGIPSGNYKLLLGLRGFKQLTKKPVEIKLHPSPFR